MCDFLMVFDQVGQMGFHYENDILFLQSSFLRILVWLIDQLILEFGCIDNVFGAIDIVRFGINGVFLFENWFCLEINDFAKFC